MDKNMGHVEGTLYFSWKMPKPLDSSICYRLAETIKHKISLGLIIEVY